ncbi:MAG: penicillin-binding protein 2 [Myxococcota bacterium]|nr:penicillin-binding protein 2 [Deltaproteobacteria bacterium]MCP4240874.1 penicillin-binding protein 2 [bacterium]MDP6075503.1 penicillin-binding protein 2 [Myxococcota bacterium]MDP6242834.1 penicillin-binding protein 2 [Myxococcota bacterium]MDP7075951.1 penicillin-binding protein 2 [Myxococcota bacterium]
MKSEHGSGARLGSGPEISIEGRLPVLIGAVLLVFGIFVLRLFQLQILQGEELAGIAQGNAVRLVRLEAPRGDILDREGRVLAATRPAFGVSVLPSDLHSPDRTTAALGMLLDTESAALRERIGTPRGRRRFRPVRLVADLPFDHWGRVESHRFELPGVLTDVRPRRHYVEGELAAHLLGTIGEISADQLRAAARTDYRSGEVIGQSGIEGLFESHLRGRAGGRNVVVDVAGRVVGDPLDEREPAPGGSVTLTIDRDLQRVAEEGFVPEVLGEPGKRGALVALDPRTGDVLALVSKPSFDPNAFAGGIDTETWQGLANDDWRPLQNRAVAGQYPPGSIYKPILAAAALADGVVTPHDRFFCPGHFRLGRRVYRCWRRGGHGEVDLRDALQQSCDVYFYQLGLQLGIDRLSDFARAFQLGRTTGFPVGDEKPGLVPTRSWKQRRFSEPWQKGETVSASIGQGFSLVTPIQMAVAYAAIANGGVILEPRVVRERVSRDGEVIVTGDPVVRDHLPVAPEYLEVLRDALEAVVAEPRGTGTAARIPGVRVAGKTGTAQVVRLKHTEDLEEGEIPVRHRDHAWFVGFAPVDAPEIVVVALVEHGGHGGSAAAPIAGKVMQRYFEKQRRDLEPALAAAEDTDAGG